MQRADEKHLVAQDQYSGYLLKKLLSRVMLKVTGRNARSLFLSSITSPNRAFDESPADTVFVCGG